MEEVAEGGEEGVGGARGGGLRGKVDVVEGECEDGGGGGEGEGGVGGGVEEVLGEEGGAGGEKEFVRAEGVRGGVDDEVGGVEVWGVEEGGDVLCPGVEGVGDFGILRGGFQLGV